MYIFLICRKQYLFLKAINKGNELRPKPSAGDKSLHVEQANILVHFKRKLAMLKGNSKDKLVPRKEILTKLPLS